jgi:hypothetical protein
MATVGGQKLVAALKAISDKAGKSAVVKVGFQDKATYPQESGKINNPVYVAQVAFWNEYGTSRIPPRPFFRQMVAKRSPKWGANIARMLPLYGYDVQRVMSLAGEKIQDQVQESILNGGWKQNADSTAAQKGFNKPLIRDAIMYRSITYVVETGK